MQRSTFVRAAVGALVIATATPSLAEGAKLAAGDPFPSTTAESPSGVHLALPADRHGQPFVVIYANSQKGGDAVVSWSHALFKALPPAIAVYAVADLSGVPGLFRGMAASGIRKQASPDHPEHRDRILILTARTPWSGLVPAGNGDDAVIVAVDAAGTVASIERVPYSDAAVADVARRVTEALRSSPPR